MSGRSEKPTIQAAIVDRLTSTNMGWTHIPGAQLDRTATDVFCDPDLAAALVRLNPVIAEQPSRVDEILRSELFEQHCYHAYSTETRNDVQ